MIALPATLRSRRSPCRSGFSPTSAFALLLATALLPAAPASADELGRLFFTPERRAALERQRLLNIQETQVVEGATLSMDGVVQRSSGRKTTWINGTPQYDNGATGVRVEVDKRDPGRATVTAGEEPPASLKVGESINRATRETSSGMGAGQITVKRIPPPGGAK